MKGARLKLGSKGFAAGVHADAGSWYTTRSIRTASSGPIACWSGWWHEELRGGAAVARVAHNHQVAGSSPAPATIGCPLYLRERVGVRGYLSP